MATTPTYSLNKPTVGGNANTWGGLLNDNFDAIDTAISAVEFRLDRQWRDDVATLIADTDLTYTLSQPGTIAAGDIVRTRAEGFSYEVAASGATDHHVTTAGGVKLYIVRKNGAWNAAAFGDLTDGTDKSTLLGEILDAVLASSDRTLILPTGTITLTAAVATKTFTGDLNLYCPNECTLSINISGTGNGLFLSGTLRATPTLSVNALSGDRSITVSDASTAQVGDLLRILGTDTPETSFGYVKQCVRRVVSVSGNVITLDEPLFWPFTTAESTSVAIYDPITVRMDGVSLLLATDDGIRIDAGVDSEIRRHRWIGPSPADNTNTDPIRVNFCDRTRIRDGYYQDFRYVNIGTGSRNTWVHDFTAVRIRHIDPNTWAEHSLIEDGVGIGTESLITDHPSVKTTFRRIRDCSVTDVALGGCNVRSIGGVVEDCEAHATHGNKIADTNGPIMAAGYTALAQSYDRVWRRFKSTTAVASARYCRNFILEDCDIPGIDVRGSSYRVLGLKVDEKTRGWASIADNIILMGAATNAHFGDVRGPVLVETVDESGTKVVITRDYPAIGWLPKVHYQTTLYSSTVSTGTTTITVPVKLRHENANPGDGGQYRAGVIKVRVIVNDAASEWQFTYRTFTGNTSIAAVSAGEQIGGATGTATVAISSVVKNFQTEVAAALGDINNGDLYWFSFDLAITTGGTTRTLRRVDMEVEEWRF